MTPDAELLANLVTWQQPVAFCAYLFMFSLGFITVTSIR